MAALSSLDAFLKTYAGDDPLKAAVAVTVQRIAAASRDIRDAIAQEPFRAGEAPAAAINADGDRQTDLDLVADRTLIAAMRAAPVAYYASEELAEPLALDQGQPIAVAADPLDGSSNIETNAPVGTIFSILPVPGAHLRDPLDAFLQPGEKQLAAGFVVYGPQLTLVLSVGSGTHIFAFSARHGGYRQIVDHAAIPPRAEEFAVNASNYRHWDEAVRLYVDDCIKGEEGPRGRNFNMRWIASLVADAYRIFVRGGVFLYPRDQRRGYHQGRLRLLYEANPLAFLVEQAGGGGTDGLTRILSLVPEALHQRVPLVFGSAREVARIARYHSEPSLIGERAPLFGQRGLFRA